MIPDNIFTYGYNKHGVPTIKYHVLWDIHTTRLSFGNPPIAIRSIARGKSI